jgi:glutaminase
MNMAPGPIGTPTTAADLFLRPPLHRFLDKCHAAFAADRSGVLPDYIPELTKANPDHFGVALATIDGHIYEIGDSTVPFTMQSVSKAFVFALALDMLGGERVESVIGVEPSGEAFNSIRLNAENRPFNPMVNSGAIACCGLIFAAERDGAFERIKTILGRFAGRELALDEAVYASESATGDRNRAIGWLLKNYAILREDVDAVLDIYFRQCSLLVTARDLAIMAATLANGGVNPVTSERVISPYAVSRTLSIMTSSGMYDYAGEWIYRVGIPAKSGVGGGIMAALPAQIGLGTYSPLLDSHGNSIRGIRLCEELSAHFDLHALNRPGDVRTCVIADYDIGRLARRDRQPHEQTILEANEDATRILELTGTLTFAAVDYVARRIHARPLPAFVVLDFRRVPLISNAAATMLAELLQDLAARGTRPVLSGLDRSSSTWLRIADHLDDTSALRSFSLLNEAIEWAEDQIVYRHGGFSHFGEPTALDGQTLLADVPQPAIDKFAKLCVVRHFHSGERIITAGDIALSVFFLQRGMVSVKLPTGVRLATLAPGTAFGELALIAGPRTADVWADTAVECHEITLENFDRFRVSHPAASELIMRNLAALLAKRLGQANTKINLLTTS